MAAPRVCDSLLWPMHNLPRPLHSLCFALVLTAALGCAGEGGDGNGTPEDGGAGSAVTPRICEGDYVITSDADIAAIADCTAITGSLKIDGSALTSVSLPVLATVEGLNANISLSDNSALMSVSFPALASLNGHLFVRNNDVLTSVSFPALSIVRSDLEVSGNDMLASVSAPVLASVFNYFTVSDNLALTSVSFPALTSVGNFGIYNNPVLSSCQALAILYQLVGYTGTTNQFGNDESQPCDGLMMPDAGPVSCDPMEFVSPTCAFCDPEDLMACEVCDEDTTCDAPTYTDNGDGTVTSSCCGLVWQQGVGDVDANAVDLPPCNDSSMPPAGCVTWERAVEYCATLSLAGGGWRLPWVRELKTLGWAYSKGTLDREAFPDFVNDWYWTPSTYGDTHWMVAISFPYASAVGDKHLRVRCVR